jgi:hypothetical protein
MSKASKQAQLQQHVRRECIVNFVINLLLNAGIAYATMSSRELIRVSGEDGFAVDMLATGALLSAILAAIFMWMGRRHGRSGKLPQLGETEMGLASRLPRSPLLASLVFALLGILAAAVSIALVSLLGVESFTPMAYAALKGLWCGAWAAVLVPVALRHGLRATATDL